MLTRDAAREVEQRERELERRFEERRAALAQLLRARMAELDAGLLLEQVRMRKTVPQRSRA